MEVGTNTNRDVLAHYCDVWLHAIAAGIMRDAATTPGSLNRQFPRGSGRNVYWLRNSVQQREIGFADSYQPIATLHYIGSTRTYLPYKPPCGEIGARFESRALPPLHLSLDNFI